MRVLMAAIIASGLLATPAFSATYALDSKGKCHDDKGKFAKQDLCVQHTYKLDAKGKCRDEKGKFAATKLCKA